MAKHRAPKRGQHRARTHRVRSAVGIAAATTIAGGVVLSSVTPAHADPGADWISTAKCESGGQWNINTGNSYYGGLQFSQSTWAGFGGTQYAARADLATPAQQVAIAEKVLAKQGPGAWPVCFRSGSSAPGGSGTSAIKPLNVTSKPLTTRAKTLNPANSVTVRPGDTLARLAAAKGTTWQALWAANSRAVSNPDRIYVGQVLRVP